jgi:hypothetical protein
VALAARTFRIFVSSTFQDLTEERNALHERVFPRLRGLCEQRGARFQEVDLRWGVRTEASLDQQALNICLAEIKRCRDTSPRPNFIVLLGDRYGWRPLPAEIPADEFEQLGSTVTAAEAARLGDWYERDDNAVPPEYCLKRREGRYEDERAWGAVERELRAILLGAVERLGWPRGDPRREKYQASATEQEIARGALSVADADEHVFCFFRSIEGLPEDVSAAAFRDLDEHGEPDEEAGVRLAVLKRRLREYLPGNVYGCAISRDGSLIVSAGQDKTLKLWDAALGDELRTLEGHAGSVSACAVSADGSFIVSAGRDKTLKLWDTATGRERATLTGHVGLVSACAVSPDGSFVVSASEDNTLKLWDTRSGDERATLGGHGGDVSDCAVSGDGSVVVSASQDTTVKLWDARRADELRTFRGHTAWVRGCDVSADGSLIASAGDDATVRLWDVDSGGERASLISGSGVTACAVSPDGSLVVSGGADGEVTIWDVRRGVELRTLRGHSGAVNACVFSGDGALVVSAGRDGTVRLWDAETGTERATITGHAGNVFEYEAGWTGNGATGGHIDRLCADVEDVLSRVIRDELARLEEIDLLEREVAAHQAFGAERAREFTGRTAILARVGDYAGAGGRHPLALFGASGSGKSTVMARAAHLARTDHPRAEIVLRFIGATPESSDGRSLLSSVCREISRRYEPAESPTPTDYRELVEEFPKRLALATEQRPLIVFLDALDQLSPSDAARRLAWLPGSLPEHARVIVSTLSRTTGIDGDAAPHECFQALKAKLPESSLVELKRMSEQEGGELLESWLRDASRTLRPAQRSEVLDRFELEGLPLYLKLAFEEARRWKSQGAQEPLRSGIPGIIRGNLFRRLADDANHGEVMVSRSLAYLGAARSGLSEDELLDLLSRDADVIEDFKARAHHTPPQERLPVVVWSRLYFDLEPYLSERAADGASLMSFYHRQLAEVVASDHLTSDDGRDRHRHLARYFADQELELAGDEGATPNLRKMSELPYQQTLGALWDELHATLTDFTFLEHKAAQFGVVETTNARGDPVTTYTGVFSLQDDYALALERMPGDDGGRDGTSGRRRIIVTGTDLGAGLQIRCPHCREFSEWDDGWRGREMGCPRCGGPWRVNEFVVERRGRRS